MKSLMAVTRFLLACVRREFPKRRPPGEVLSVVVDVLDLCLEADVPDWVLDDVVVPRLVPATSSGTGFLPRPTAL